MSPKPLPSLDDPLTEYERNLLMRLFSRPGEFPQSFWTAVLSKIDLDGRPSSSNILKGDTPLARVSLGVAQSITNATTTTVDWDTVLFDNDRIWDDAEPSRLTCKEKGAYLVGFNGLIDSHATGYRSGRLRVNGADVADIDYTPAVNGDHTAVRCYTILDMDELDYVEAQVFHSAGVNRNFRGDANSFWMVRIAQGVTA